MWGWKMKCVTQACPQPRRRILIAESSDFHADFVTHRLSDDAEFDRIFSGVPHLIVQAAERACHLGLPYDGFVLDLDLTATVHVLRWLQAHPQYRRVPTALTSWKIWLPDGLEVISKRSAPNLFVQRIAEKLFPRGETAALHQPVYREECR